MSHPMKRLKPPINIMFVVGQFIARLRLTTCGELHYHEFTF